MEPVETFDSVVVRIAVVATSFGADIIVVRFTLPTVVFCCGLLNFSLVLV